MLELLRVLGMLLNAFAIVVLAATLAVTFGAIIFLVWEWWSTRAMHEIPETHTRSSRLTILR